MPEHHDPTPSERDPIIDELRMQRPLATPPESVRAAHQAALESAVDKAAARGGASWRPRRRLVVAVAASVAIIAGVVAANVGRDTPDSELVAGENDAAKPSSAQPASPADDALTSAACGGPLPFDVPVGDGHSGPISGPAPGADAPSADGQLVAHWTNESTSIEVRWPAEADSDAIANSGDLPDALPVANLVVADLTIGLIADDDGSLGERDESWRENEGVRGERSRSGADGTFTFAVAAYETNRDASNPQDLVTTPIWGEEMCGVVQLTVRAQGDEDVLAAAEELYDELIAPGGSLVPAQDDEPLVAARTEAAELEPVTPCDVPEGYDQGPTQSTPVEGAVYDTAEAALIAHLDTRVITDEGPFGKPVTTHTVPTAGYMAMSLPDGTIAYKFPDIVAYFIASPVDGGWSITRYEGPTC